MKEVGWFGDMLEDHVEKIHQDMDKFHQRVTTLRSFEKRAKSYSHHEKIANNAGVLAANKKCNLYDKSQAESRRSRFGDMS
jgi:uncharacterized protein YhaN